MTNLNLNIRKFFRGGLSGSDLLYDPSDMILQRFSVCEVRGAYFGACRWPSSGVHGGIHVRGDGALNITKVIGGTGLDRGDALLQSSPGLEECLGRGCVVHVCDKRVLDLLHGVVEVVLGVAEARGGTARDRVDALLQRSLGLRDTGGDGGLRCCVFLAFWVCPAFPQLLSPCLRSPSAPGLLRLLDSGTSSLALRVHNVTTAPAGQGSTLAAPGCENLLGQSRA